MIYNSFADIELSAMVLGRVVRILVQMALLGLKGTPFTFSAVFSSVVIVGLPGIILQLLFIPLLMYIFKRNKKALG